MEITFWILLSLIIYCYFGYPFLLVFLSFVRFKPVHKSSFVPSVSVVLSVWNEEDVIEEKIKNLLSLEYPREKIEILIGSDGSDDRTNEIIKSFEDKRVRLIERDDRQGKSLTINELVALSNSDVIVFTDARQPFEKDAIAQLVNNFSDSKVGCVSGELLFSQREGSTAKGINLYWNYEKFIRSYESRLHSMLGATGAIYAIRKELFVNIPKNVILDDMFVPLKIISQGFRAVYDDTAKAYDEVADSPREEYRRKTRTLFGNYQIFGLFLEMFVPFKSPIAIQLFSHKFLRVIIPFLMIALILINLFLLDVGYFRLILILQTVFYVMAVIGALARKSKYGILKTVSKVCYVPYVFCLLNFSALIGFIKYVFSEQNITWQKARD